MYSLTFICLILMVNLNGMMANTSDDCLKSVFEDNLNLVFRGDQAKGIKPIDPVTVPKIASSVHGLSMEFYDTDLIHHGSCSIRNVRFNADQNRFSGDIFCKNIDLVGKKHVLGGRLLNLMDVNGSGPFAINCKDYLIRVDVPAEIGCGPDGNTTVKIKTEEATKNLYLHSTGGIVFAMEGLYPNARDSKRRSDQVHALANNYWAFIARDFQDEVFKQYMEKYFEHFNIYAEKDVSCKC